jgi:hypothetical protein
MMRPREADLLFAHREEKDDDGNVVCRLCGIIAHAKKNEESR